MSLNTLERDDLLRRIAWLNAEVDKIKRMLKGEQVGTARIADAAITNAKIEDLSVTTAKIALLAVDTAQIKNTAITNAKIASLTWDKAQGGTATLGGAANGDGVLVIKSSSDITIITIDKDGFLYNDGITDRLLIGDDGT